MIQSCRKLSKRIPRSGAAHCAESERLLHYYVRPTLTRELLRETDGGHLIYVIYESAKPGTAGHPEG
jgi:hypothetical protein